MSGIYPNAFDGPHSEFVSPSVPKETVEVTVQERRLRSTVSRVVAGVFIALAALAIAGFIVAGVVISPILFVGVLAGAALLTVACTKTSRHHTGWHAGHGSGYEVVTPVRPAHVGMPAGSFGMAPAYSPPPTFVTPSGNVLPGQARGRR